MDAGFLFTVFTATYNRAHTLSRVYDSLCAQTFRDFEWVVVDDGSTDRTAELVGEWQQRASLPIRYIRQENQGKHIAFNTGVRAARGQLFVSIDSDDWCVPNALERFKWNWEQIPANARDRFIGVTALCADQHGHLVGSKFPRDVIDSDSREMRYRYGARGDKWGFQRVDVLKRFPFPERSGTSLLAIDSVLWNVIARSYKTRYVNEILHTYWRSEAHGEQLSNTRLSTRAAETLASMHCSVLNEDLGWFWRAPRLLLKSAALYSRFSFGSGVGVLHQRRTLPTAAQVLWAVALPVGFAASLLDRSRNPGLGA